MSDRFNQDSYFQREAGKSLIANIIADIFFTLITCGLYNIYVQSRQIRSLNLMLKTQKYSFGRWAVFTLLTCGIYHVYHEYIMCQDIESVTGRPTQLPLVCILLSVFGLSIVADAIQQNEINKYFGGPSLI